MLYANMDGVRYMLHAIKKQDQFVQYFTVNTCCLWDILYLYRSRPRNGLKGGNFFFYERHFMQNIICISKKIEKKNCPGKIEKNHLQNLLRNTRPLFCLTARAAQTAQTEEFMFQYVAYRQNVYKTGDLVYIAKALLNLG